MLCRLAAEMVTSTTCMRVKFFSNRLEELFAGMLSLGLHDMLLLQLSISIVMFALQRSALQ